METFSGSNGSRVLHTWNVNAFVAAIDTYDYQDIDYTELLWIAEGLTSYYDEILPVRAGLVSVSDYREQLANTIDSVVDNPGYGQDTLARASFSGLRAIIAAQTALPINPTAPYLTSEAAFWSWCLILRSAGPWGSAAWIR